MIPDIKELNFPKIDGRQYATLTHASVPLNDMGEKTITTQVKIDGDIVPDFSQDWEVEFQGEKYIMPLRIPQGAKENTSLNSTIDLTFQHWAIYQLKRWPFVTIQQIAAGTYLPDEEVATVQLNLKDFCILFGQVLEYYYGDAITIDLNPAWQYDSASTLITISHTKIWDVLIDAFHDKYGVRWEIKAASGNSNTVKGGERYVIRVGYSTTEVDHIFEYGFEGGLLKVERQVQSEEIRNILKGRGGETNIPFRYFKNTDPNNPDFAPDPDWVEELANIYFPNLMGATFRSYVQGWKAAHISKYPGYKAVGESNAYAPWAYRKGYTDTKFHPVEFVADEITINPAAGDKQVEILPGYSPYVKKGSSLDKYGPLPDTLDNNDDIYPTLQGTGLDIAIDVEQIESDDVAESTESDAQVRTLPEEKSATISVAKTARKQLTIKSQPFVVEMGKYANLDEGTKSIALSKEGKKWVWNGDKTWRGHVETFQIPVEDMNVTIEDATLTVINTSTSEEVSASGMPGGVYSFLLKLTVYNTTDNALNVTVTCPEPKLTYATLSDRKWKNTFDIWVQNIWSSAKKTTETAAQYSERVWKPVLGDREGNTAKVVFTSGALAVSEDYEFTIVDFPVYDTSKTFTDENGLPYDSHWRITLAKSDAELEATGFYVPSTQKQGKAGDTFVFIGTEMTHVPYVVDAEKRLDDWKKDQLGEVKEIKPTFVVTTDRVRLNNEGKPDALINQLRVGNSIRLADKRFVQPIGDRAYETLYLQSITYTYREPTSDDAALNPDVEIVLGNEYTTSANAVSIMQGDISALQRQVGSISNIEQIVRAVGDKLYLRKDGISDRSLSPTQFFSLLTSGDFRAGIIGGAGWGFFKDENGSWVLETDRLSVRQDMSVNSLVINQAEGRGGMEIDTAAYMSVTRVDDTDDGYVCYFDQREGSVGNLFHVDDVAFCNQWTPENADLKFYKRRVTAVGIDNITLSKTDVNGTGIPAEGDNIIHYGNYTDKTRQYVKVRDVVGGGYERYIEELNSVNAEGVEYYFVGKQAGESRWFVGHKDEVPYSGKGDGSYIEYINRRFNLNNVSLSVNTTIGDKTLEEYIKLVSPPVEQEDIEGFVNAIVDPKLEGIQDQIDGVIETWFANGVPTLTNYPASGWNTDALKIQHLGDLYYDNDTGTAYRFSQNAQGGYHWNVITDDAITKALAAAKTAQDTADGKRRVFTSQPVPPYDEGDMWVNATYPAGTTAATRDPANGKYYNDLLRCNAGVHKTTGSFAISDWGLASSYTDDTLANEALSQVRNLDYLKAAFKQKTTIDAGVVLTSLVSLGVNNDDFTTQTVYSGISGLYDATKRGGGIAAWYGGEMVDAFDYLDSATGVITVPTGVRAAASLFRMDGTGYLSKGNLWWDVNGNLFLGSGVTISGNGNNATLSSMLNAISGISSLLVPIDEAGNELDWRYAATAVALKARKNLCADGEISTLGYQAGSGGGSFSGALSDLTDVQLAGLAVGDLIQWNGTDWVNVKASELGIGGSVDLSNYVTLNTAQTVTGAKTFTSALQVQQLMFQYGNEINATSGRIVIGYRDTPNGVNLCYNNAPLTYGSAAHKIWHAGNDGAGSGLDADLLDGLHAEAFVRRISNYHTNLSPTAYIKICTLPISSDGTHDGITIDGFIGAFYASYRSFFSVSIGRRDGLRFKGWYQGGGESYMNIGVNSNGEVYLICYQRYVTYSLSVKHEGVTIDYTGSVSTPKDTSWTLLSSVSGVAHLGSATVLDTANYTSTLDGRYVKKSGDEMTGMLSITRAASDDSAGYTNGFVYRSSVGVKPYIHIGYGTGGKNNGANVGFCYKGDQSTNNYLFFGFVANNELMRLTANGTVEIDHVEYHAINLRRKASGATGCSIGCTIGDGTFVGDFGFDGTKYFNVRNGSYQTIICALQDGDVGFGTTSPTATIHVRRPWSKNVGNWITLAVLDSDTVQAGQYYSFVMGARDSAKNRGMWYYYHAGDGSDNNRMTFCFQGVNYLFNILASGKIGIGTTNPLDKVHVHDGRIRVSYAADNRHSIYDVGGVSVYAPSNIGFAGGIGVYTQSGDAIGYSAGYLGGTGGTLTYFYYGGSYSDPWMVLLPNKTFVIGAKTNSSGAKLHVAGTIYSTQESTTLSDRRVKSDIRTLPFRGALIPRTYIKDGRPSIGFIAQEVNEVYPELVNKGVTPEALWSLNYQSATAVLAAWCNVHDDEIAKLNRRVTQVENELKAYRRA